MNEKALKCKPSASTILFVAYYARRSKPRANALGNKKGGASEKGSLLAPTRICSSAENLISLFN